MIEMYYDYSHIYRVWNGCVNKLSNLDFANRNFTGLNNVNDTTQVDLLRNKQGHLALDINFSTDFGSSSPPFFMFPFS